MKPVAIEPVAVHPRTATPQETLNTYCLTCHSNRAKTGGLSLEGVSLSRVVEDRELWEKVVTKLELRAMPPVGAKKPDAAAYDAFSTFLRTELDRYAAANPNPGRSLARRLTRVEYTNAIRDLLAFELDGDAMLPPDNVGHGFDNIGDVLSISPVLMERYMLLAERISRLAVGDPRMRPAAETYEVTKRSMQTDRMSDDLPFGSRGGLAVRHLFPADGEYVVRVRLHKNQEGYIRGLRQQHHLEVRVDGSRVKMFTIGGKAMGRSGPIWSTNQIVEYSGDPAQVVYEFTADEALETRLTAKAGTRLVGVSFLQRRLQPTGVLTPELVSADILSYKGGEPTVESVTIEGPYNPTGVTETPSRRRIFSCRPTIDEEEEPCARRILSSLARRAYRRPVQTAEVEELLTLYRRERAEHPFEVGLQVALQGMLAGPEFLFRIERDPTGVREGQPYRVGDFELASRLSFFLWSSLPDDALLEVAARGTISDPRVLEQQVRRMLADGRSRSLVNNFAAQWLSLRNLTVVTPDVDQFPDFDEELRQAMRQETELLIDSMVREDRGVAELLSADYTFLNERLARHYGIPGVRGSRFRRVVLEDETRRGLLGHASILTVTSFSTRTSPVLRGRWVLENLLEMPPPSPPPDIPALEEKNKQGQALTMRAALEQHRANPACSSCHKLMDPIGFALENFDAVGALRTVDRRSGEPIQSDGVLFDGRKFQSLVEFNRLLLNHSDRFVYTATRKLLTYAVGRPLEYYDEPVLRQIVRDARSGGSSWSSLIMGVVRSAPFQMRRSRTS